MEREPQTEINPSNICLNPKRKNLEKEKEKERDICTLALGTLEGVMVVLWWF